MRTDQRPATSDIPTRPGVYRWWDERDRVIYVGKAKNLRNRITSYFSNPNSLHPRTREMVSCAVRVDWVVVSNEVESLQLEHTWITEYEPRFNVRFRDDKSYPWLVLSSDQEFPRVFTARGNRRKGWTYFGPFVNASGLRETLDRLLKVYPMRSCSDSTFSRAKAANRPCLLAHIGKCTAPCVGQISEAEHRTLAEGIANVFEGKSASLLRGLRADMETASADLDFERAAKLRDDINAIEFASQRTRVVLAPEVDCDLVGLAADELAACVQLFHVRDGRLVGQRNFTTTRPEDTSDAGLIEHALHSIYEESGLEIPREVLVSTEPPDLQTARLWLSARRSSVVLKVPERGDKAALMQSVIENARAALVLHRSRRGADIAARGEALSELGEALGLPVAPLRIECIDVSHLDGEEVVASLVVFEDGLAAKGEYRRFLLRHGLGNNDVASIREVVERRFKEVPPNEVETGRKKFRYEPALLVIDGGAPQVNAAAEQLRQMGLEIPLVGLAKRLEEVWLPANPDPVIFPRNSEALFLLQRIRDEAHRFAIEFQRKRMRRASIQSVLDDVPGLGEVRKQALLKHFGSVKRLRSASIDEIAEVKGFGRGLAASVHQALGGTEEAPAVNVTTGEIVE